MELKQNRISDRRHFRLEKDGVWFKIKTPTEQVESKFKYEELGLGTMTVKKKEASWVFIILTMISIYALKFLLDNFEPENRIDLLFIIFSSILLIGSFVFLMIETRKTVIGITDGSKTFSLLRNVPSTETVDQFIAELHERIRDRNIDLIVRPNDPNIDLEYKLNQLQYLLDIGTINQERFDQVEKTLSSKGKRTIGYRNKNEENSES